MLSSTYMSQTSMERELKRGTTEMLVLTCIENEARHGYDIGRLISQRSKAVIDLNLAALYHLLYRLEEKGWIKGRWVEMAGERRRRYYRITPKGREVLEAQRESWRRFQIAVRNVAEGNA